MLREVRVGFVWPGISATLLSGFWTLFGLLGRPIDVTDKKEDT